MKCSKCGMENKNNAKFCIYCGNSLEIRINSIPNIPPVKEYKNEYIVCKKCGSKIIAGSKFCNKCGKIVK